MASKKKEPKYVFVKRPSQEKIDSSTKLYFHGAITREIAEQRLLQCSQEDGTFLIRQSTNKVGNTVLSVVVNHKPNRVVHYQVNRKADGLVSIEGGPSFPGPVELVEYYMNNKDRLLTVLTMPCNRPDESVELYKGISHQHLEEATRAVLKKNDIEDENAVRQFKIQFEPIIGALLHKEQPWFHGIIPRSEAESRLRQTGAKDGTFLFRERGKPRDTFALVLCFNDTTYHYLFERNNQGQLSIKQGRLFENLMGVVSYYSQNCEGLWSTLKEACDVRHFQYRPRSEVNAHNILLNTYIQEALNKEVARKPSEELKKFRSIKRKDEPGKSNPQVLPHGGDLISFDQPGGVLENGRTLSGRELPPVPSSNSNSNEDAWKMEKIYDVAKLSKTEGYVKLTSERSPMQLDARRLTLNEELGHGNFGSVLKGDYKTDDGKKIPVAVKTLKDEDISSQKSEVLDEAKIMAKLDHPHIVRLIGVTQSPSLMIVMEIAPLGPLNKYLKKNKSMQLINILILMLQVDEGMDYLESQRFVHRDLAARNVLVVSKDFVKISDFGMSRATGAGNEYYRAERAGKWPLKWYAPECIYYRKFTSKGDVWSYGVTLWEALTYGKKPFEGMKGPQIVDYIETGGRLDPPPGCPPFIYEIMRQCWQYNVDHRPTFNQIGSNLHRFLQNPEGNHTYPVEHIPDRFV